MKPALLARLSLSLVPCLALGLSACVEPPELGTDEGALVTDERELFDLIDPSLMRALYGINPPRHAEKAYQAGDPAPPLSARATVVDASGTITALATTIYNRPPFGRAVSFSICDETGAVLTTRTVTAPGRLDVHGLVPGTEVYIQPRTIGTMVKLLTPEQIAAAGF